MTIAMPPFEDPHQRSAPSIVSTLLAVGAGWALLRLVAGGRTAAPASVRGRNLVDHSRQPARHEDGEQHAPASAASEPGRGRQAETPTEIPAAGWKDILWRTYQEFSYDRLMSVAAGVTYYALLALFPALAALVSLYGVFAYPATIRDHLATLSGILPGGAVEVIGEQVGRIAATGEGTLGLSFAIGLAVSLWSANAGMKAVFDALNIVYDEEEKRGFVALNLRSLTFTAGAVAFLLVALGGVVVLPVVLDFVGLGGGTE